MELTGKHKNTLLSIAEWSIQDYLITGKRSRLPESFEIDMALESRMGAFVTVYVKHKLRGCIGTFSESKPLYENVHQMSVEAICEDNRFKSVSHSELKNLEVEISVLSPRIRVENPDDIIIGKHGIYMINGILRATLLPQVALENNWSVIQFLECCAENKLGLCKNSWKESELFVFETVVFR
ncbi:MAG: AmmeMemoRadiSam system protein A [Bacteroidales bacterium]